MVNSFVKYQEGGDWQLKEKARMSATSGNSIEALMI